MGNAPRLTNAGRHRLRAKPEALAARGLGHCGASDVCNPRGGEHGCICACSRCTRARAEAATAGTGTNREAPDAKAQIAQRAAEALERHEHAMRARAYLSAALEMLDRARDATASITMAHGAIASIDGSINDTRRAIALNDTLITATRRAL